MSDAPFLPDSIDKTVHRQRIDAEIETALWGFVDDVTIRFRETETEEDETVRLINIRSRSRVGKGDLGKNARNIRAIRRGLADRLPLVPHTEFP